MTRVGRVDVALVTVSAAFLHTLTWQRAVEHTRSQKSEPKHHQGLTRLPGTDLLRYGE